MLPSTLLPGSMYQAQSEVLHPTSLLPSTMLQENGVGSISTLLSAQVLPTLTLLSSGSMWLSLSSTGMLPGDMSESSYDCSAHQEQLLSSTAKDARKPMSYSMLQPNSSLLRDN